MEIAGYFLELFTLYHMVILVAGIAGGLLLGAAPGLSPTMAVALLIPFTFHMDAASGLILLGAVYAATIAGGAVSAILINVPGAPANIATTFDGYPMAKQGRATEALHYAFIGTLIGGVIGILVLIFLAPPISRLALAFGPAEMFWVAILGVTVMGSVGSSSLVRGLLAGAFGMWLSTIGDSPTMAEPRFIFTSHLTGGIHIVVALIGLFAIPQVYSLLETAGGQRRDNTIAFGAHSLVQSIRKTLREKLAVAIGAIVGVIVGIIPGAGGQISGLIAYDQSRKFSRNRDNYGKGEPGGVISAETANNAMVGPSLVPLLSLGVPGSPTAAVLLGGLLIHGIFPGPDLFDIHARVAWIFIASLLFGQLLIFGLGLYLASLSRFIISIPNNYMAAGIVVLAVFGAYSIQHNFSDVLIMMVLGTGMFLLMRIGFEPAPLVLGIILGPIAEGNFQLGRMIGEPTVGTFAYFTTGTINLILIGLCLISIAYSAVFEIRDMRRRRAIAQGGTA